MCAIKEVQSMDLERPIIPSSAMLGFSIFTMLCCGWICGLVALIYSVSVSTLYVYAYMTPACMQDIL